MFHISSVHRKCAPRTYPPHQEFVRWVCHSHLLSNVILNSQGLLVTRRNPWLNVYRRPPVLLLLSLLRFVSVRINIWQTFKFFRIFFLLADPVRALLEPMFSNISRTFRMKFTLYNSLLKSFSSY